MLLTRKILLHLGEFNQGSLRLKEVRKERIESEVSSMLALVAEETGS
jgi:hypothetical protein